MLSQIAHNSSQIVWNVSENILSLAGYYMMVSEHKNGHKCWEDKNHKLFSLSINNDQNIIIYMHMVSYISHMISLVNICLALDWMKLKTHYNTIENEIL